MKIPSLLATAAKAALDKKATDAVVLDVSASASFTDHFLLLTGANQRQLLAIVEAVEEALRAEGRRPRHTEGYPRQEWILLDYGDFVVHVFSPRVRSFYDLERLWGGAAREEVRE